jgi:23S rRNA (adenine2503-C2)-methyltransferase
MKIVGCTGRDDIATVFVGKLAEDRYVEFVESVQPPIPREKKWVLIVSTLLGCPVGCSICDAGGWYKGKLSKDEIIGQIDYLVKRRFPDGNVPVEKFKIQFARMGEPMMNSSVLDALEELPSMYNAPGFIPSISTVAPVGCEENFKRLYEIKERLYANGKFQMQFSIHTTDEKLRNESIPINKWSFDKIASYGEKFYSAGDRKITLNFALSNESTLDPSVLKKYFNPDKFVVKITPINPTITAEQNKVSSYLLDSKLDDKLEIVETLKKDGFDVLVSIGELEENQIGSNCGQYVNTFINNNKNISTAYSYKLDEITSEI